MTRKTKEVRTPSNIEAERAVLGSMLMDEEAVKVVDLVVSDFVDPQTQAIFKAMVSIRSRDEIVNTITVAHELHNSGGYEVSGGAAALAGLVAETPTSFHIREYERIVRECSINRGLIDVGEAIAEVGFKNKKPEEGIVFGINLLRELSQRARPDNIISPPEAAEAAVARYTLLRKTNPGIASGFGLLDDFLGGFSEGEFIILAARAGLGKTTFGMQMATNVAKKENSLLISLEMAPGAIVDKRIAQMISKPPRVLKMGNYTDDTFDAMVLALGEYSESNFYLTKGSMTCAQIAMVIEKMKIMCGVRFVVIDYLHLLKSEFGSNPYERISGISNSLANIAKDFNVTIVALSQLSRSSEIRLDKRPVLSDLRDSGSIEQDADMVMFLYRDSYYDRKAPNKAEAELIIAKDRLRGRLGFIKLRWDDKKEVYNG